MSTHSKNIRPILHTGVSSGNLSCAGWIGCYLATRELPIIGTISSVRVRREGRSLTARRNTHVLTCTGGHQMSRPRAPAASAQRTIERRPRKRHRVVTSLQTSRYCEFRSPPDASAAVNVDDNDWSSNF
ncbi:hypothetical protein EVAR_31113_1 [Eumeta japonica]|uniref:Uncharacterized protein n=1 Tax=Eumeta variegata TaxID=151549 RepID=A0A4C1VFT5_EUMVA|nr:hypothetical protein EVAR_31113_1 [Eumeta japonica]